MRTVLKGFSEVSVLQVKHCCPIISPASTARAGAGVTITANGDDSRNFERLVFLQPFDVAPRAQCGDPLEG